VQTTLQGTVVPLAGGLYRYTWMIQVDMQSPDPLGAVWIPCPNAARLDSLHFQKSRVGSHVLNGWRRQDDDLQYCEVFSRVPPGDSIRVDLVTDYLPSFGEVRSQSFVHGVSWPTSDPISDNDQCVHLVDSLSGLDANGVHRTSNSVVPGRAPNEATTPAATLSFLAGDLAQACASGWISPQGICQSLESKLTSIRRSIASGNKRSAAAQLQAFRQEVGNQAPTHISSEAAAVLLMTAARLASLL
jgi:hypothetical protein